MSQRIVVSSDIEDKSDLTYEVAPEAYEVKGFWQKILRILYLLVLPFYYILKYVLLPIMILLMVALSPLYLVVYIITLLPKEIYRLHLSIVSKYLINDFRVEGSNAVLAALYELYNYLLLTPPILNIIVVVSYILGVIILWIPLYSLIRIIKRKIVNPLTTLIFLDKKDEYASKSIIELLVANDAKITPTYTQLVLDEVKEYESASTEEEKSSPAIMITLRIKFFCDNYKNIALSACFLNYKSLNIDELNKVKTVLAPVIEYIPIYKDLMDIGKKYQKQALRKAKKRKYKETSYFERKRTIKTIILTPFWFLKYLYEKKKDVMSERECIEIDKRTLGKLRDIEILTSKNLDKIEDLLQKKQSQKLSS